MLYGMRWQIQHAWAEFCTMMLFVFIGCGTAAVRFRLRHSSLLRSMRSIGAHLAHRLTGVSMRMRALLRCERTQRWPTIVAAQYGHGRRVFQQLWRFGADVEVVGPVGLRSKVQKQFLAAAVRYV